MNTLELEKAVQSALAGNFQPLRQWAVSTASSLEGSNHPTVAARAIDAYDSAVIANSGESVTVAALQAATAAGMSAAEKRRIFQTLIQKINSEKGTDGEKEIPLRLVTWIDQVSSALTEHIDGISPKNQEVLESARWYHNTLTGWRDGRREFQETFLAQLERENWGPAVFLKDLLAKSPMPV